MLKFNFNSSKIWAIFIVLVIGVICLTITEYIKTEKEIGSLIQSENINAEKIVKQITQEQGRVLYIIDFGEGNVKSYQITPSENSTVFSLLEELAKRENFQLEFTFYKDMGVFVESIGGFKNGTDNKFWQYWVNDELPMVAADKKEIKRNDKVEWKFAPSPF